jgi:hypothetical protein
MAKTAIKSEEFEEYVEDNMGYCARCREFTTDGVEPDAEWYECEECGCPTVCGAEMALIMGLIVVLP